MVDHGRITVEQFKGDIAIVIETSSGRETNIVSREVAARVGTRLLTLAKGVSNAGNIDAASTSGG